MARTSSVIGKNSIYLKPVEYVRQFKTCYSVPYVPYSHTAEKPVFKKYGFFKTLVGVINITQRMLGLFKMWYKILTTKKTQFSMVLTLRSHCDAENELNMEIRRQI
jgi:hypothetical protein